MVCIYVYYIFSGSIEENENIVADIVEKQSEMSDNNEKTELFNCKK